MTKFIEFQARAVVGASIERAWEEALQTAKRLGIRIRLQHNSHYYEVTPTSDQRDFDDQRAIWDKYDDEMIAQRQKDKS